jgi:hypothetical protein
MPGISCGNNCCYRDNVSEARPSVPVNEIKSKSEQAAAAAPLCCSEMPPVASPSAVVAVSGHPLAHHTLSDGANLIGIEDLPGAVMLVYWLQPHKNPSFLLSVNDWRSLSGCCQ